MSNVVLFEEKHVRRAWSDGEGKWYFAIADVVAILSGSHNPQVYWRVLKKRLRAEGNQTVTNCNALKLTAAVAPAWVWTDCKSSIHNSAWPRRLINISTGF